MVRKLKLKVDLFEGISILSIASQYKDYRLAYHLNTVLDLDLQKYDDYRHLQQDRAYSWFYDRDVDSGTTYYLIGNHHPEGKLVPSQKGIDYFLIIKNLPETKGKEKLAKRIRTVAGILGVFEVNQSSLKNLGSIIQGLELHEMERVPGKKK